MSLFKTKNMHTMPSFSAPLRLPTLARLAGACGCVLGLVSCATYTAPLATIPARQIDVQKASVAGAQRLKVGMAGSEVIELLGSPNIVTSAPEGGETWVYDKIARELEFIAVQDGSWLLSRRTQSSSVATSTERSLIVVVRFDSGKRVSNVAYRQSSY